MKSLVALLLIPSSLLTHNSGGFVNAESIHGGVIWRKTSDRYLLTQGASEQNRRMTEYEKLDNSVCKCPAGNDPTSTIHGTSSKPGEPCEGLGQADYSKVKAHLLKKSIGLKINRMSGSEMEFPFIPDSYIYVTAEDSRVRAFNILTYMEDNALPFTRKVYVPVETLTTTESSATETKRYRRALAENNDGPWDDEHDFFSKGMDSEEEEAIPPIGMDNVDLEEVQLRKTIDRILNWIYRIDEDGKKVLIMQEELDLSMKEDLITYCQIMKKVDKSGTLEEHQIGNEMDVFGNLIKLLQKHGDETVFTLRRKLRNPAVCMQNVKEWVLKRRGLVLPDSSSNDPSEHDKILDVNPKWSTSVRSNSRDASALRYSGDEEGMVDLEKLKMKCYHIFGLNGGVHADGDHPENSDGKDLCSPKDKEEVE
uniref:Pkn-TSERA1 protein n=1 Tax=Plasmodium knowlesi TaxID=5850 RepID=F1SZ12_PLAKN|nr:Pkn-TSERA1 [Plasmodium knowlesi]